MPNTTGAVLVGLIYGELPFMVLPIYASIDRFDFTLLEAASDLGADRRRAFLRVMLPLTMPGVAAGSVLVFIPTVGQFVVSDLLGGAKVDMLGNRPAAPVHTLEPAELAAGIGDGADLHAGADRRDYLLLSHNDRGRPMIEATSQSQVQPAAATRAGRRANWRTLLLGIHSTLMYVFLYAPIVVLVLFSFTTDSFGARLTGFTFSWYTRLLQDERLIGAAWNTLKVALASTVLSTIIGTLTALAMVERYRFRGRTATDALLYLPIVIPEIVMALALLAFFAFTFGIIESLTGLQLKMSLTTVMTAYRVQHLVRGGGGACQPEGLRPAARRGRARPGRRRVADVLAHHLSADPAGHYRRRAAGLHDLAR